VVANEVADVAGLTPDETERRQESASPINGPAQPVTISDLLKLVLADPTGLTVKPASIAGHVKLLQSFFGDKLARDLTSSDFDVYGVRRRNRELSYGCGNCLIIGRELATLKRAYELGVEAGLVPPTLLDVFPDLYIGFASANLVSECEPYYEKGRDNDTGESTASLLDRAALQAQAQVRCYFGSKLTADQVTTRDLEEYVKRQVGVPPWVIHRHMHSLADAYRRAFEYGLVRKQLLITAERNPAFFTPEEYQKQLAALKDYARDVTEFAYLTGWEQAEVFSLRWDTNYDSLKPAMLFESRRFLVAGELLRLIQKRLALAKTSRDNLIFHRDGHRLCKNTFNKEWKRAGAIAGVTRKFLELRPAAARNLRAAAYGAEEVKRLTGYTKTVPVSYRYEIVTQDTANQAESTNDVHSERSRVSTSPRATPAVKLRQTRPQTSEPDDELFALAYFYARGLSAPKVATVSQASRRF
jgi:hypothetical protein